MHWHVYRLEPIDYGWHHLATVREALAASATPCEGSDPREGVDSATSLAFLQGWESAKDAAVAAGWDGRFRLEPRVFWIPGELEMLHGFVFKQDHNGATFVVSPRELAYLGTPVSGP